MNTEQMTQQQIEQMLKDFLTVYEWLETRTPPIAIKAIVDRLRAALKEPK
jgi:hypothetical protein